MCTCDAEWLIIQPKSSDLSSKLSLVDQARKFLGVKSMGQSVKVVGATAVP